MTYGQGHHHLTAKGHVTCQSTRIVNLNKTIGIFIALACLYQMLLKAARDLHDLTRPWGT